MILSGIILAMMADTGPLPEINISELDETSAIKLSISLMTALGLGESQDQLNQLHGSFPVPGRKELALAYPFLISAVNSSDIRIQEHGRDCTLFLLFPRESKSVVLSAYGIIESVITKSLKPLKTQDDLTIEFIKKVLSDLEKAISSVKDIHVSKVIEPSEAEIEQMQAEKLRQQKFSSIIRDITQIQTSITALLDEFMVFTDPPILEGSYYMRPKIRAEDFLKILPLISQFEKVLTRLDGENLDTVREIVNISILVRIGNMFYWKALISQQKLEFEKSIEFYIRANQLKDDSILYLTIGSIYRKLNRTEESKNWIETGFERMRQRKESIRISRNMLFGDVT